MNENILIKKEKYEYSRVLLYNQSKQVLNFEIIDYIEELEQQNKEMLDVIVKINEYAKISDDRFAGYGDLIYHGTKEIIDEFSK